MESTVIAAEPVSYNNYEQQESRKRPLDDEVDPATDSDRKRTNGGPSQPLLKLLVPNYAAGALIGKGGSNLAELQTKFGATIRLSSNKEYYPGTDERIVVLLGEVSKIIDFNYHIMEQVQAIRPNPNDPVSALQPPREDGRPQQVKIVLTNAAAGLLIGRGGATIKALQEESSAKITIGNRDDAAVPGERLLKITGSMEQRLEACRQVIEKIAGDASNMASGSTKYGTNNSLAGKFSAGAGGGQQNNMFNALANNSMQRNSMAGMGGLSNQGGMSNNNQGMGGFMSQGQGQGQGQGGMTGLANQNAKSNLKTAVQILVEVPDILVGSLLGKGGSTISEFIQFSGAKIQFSGKNEFAPGTTDRILTITGDMTQSQTAYFLINQKVEQAQSELANHR